MILSVRVDTWQSEWKERPDYILGRRKPAEIRRAA